MKKKWKTSVPDMVYEKIREIEAGHGKAVTVLFNGRLYWGYARNREIPRKLEKARAKGVSRK